jgi:hypothetical protein
MRSPEAIFVNFFTILRKREIRPFKNIVPISAKVRLLKSIRLPGFFGFGFISGGVVGLGYFFGRRL